MKRFRFLLACAFACASSIHVFAAGYTGSEPTSYTTSIYVDGAWTGTENGSSASPFNTVTEGINALNSELSAGRSVRLLIKPGVYRESLPSISAGQNTSDRSKNSNITRQDTWMRIDRWGASGEVILDGCDDWSNGLGEGGPWTQVAGHANVYSRAWTRNWGLWGGGKGSANVSLTEGQRREMVFVDYNDGKGWQLLRQHAIETYLHERPSDNGNASSWNGPGVWTYTGYAGLGVLTDGSYGVVELSSDSADAATTPNSDMTSYQPGVLITKNSTGATVKKTFKQVYDEATNKAPASETNKLYLKLPAGVQINDVRIAVAIRETGFAIEKRNYVLANLTVRGFANRMFGSPAIRIGREYYDWYLTNGNALIENLVVRDNNSNGMGMAGMKDITLRRCTFDNNGATGLNHAYVYSFRLEDCIFRNTGWRAHKLGKRYSFIPGAMKSWNTVLLELEGGLFLDNLYKGFYSDAGLQQATFNGVEFRGNNVGSMHEVGRGLFAYNRCKFIGNRQGLAIIQSSNVAVDDCDFVDNEFAIVPEAKSRTAYTMAATYDWGSSMLVSSEQSIDIDNISVSNSRLHSNRPGARIIAQGSQYSSEAKYLQEMRDEANYANNRYYLRDHNFPFENDTEYATFDEWIAATGEQGASWDPSLSTGEFAPEAAGTPAYQPGFIWKRSSDWSRRTGGESGIAQQVLDANGSPAWYHAVTHGRVGGGAGSATPWYSTPLDYLSLSRGGKFIYKNEMEHWPAASQTRLSTYNYTASWNSKGAPIAVWRNPTGRNLSLRITGTLTIEWSSNATGGSLAIALLRANGSYEELFARGYTKPADGSATVVAPEGVDSIGVGPGDRILVSGFVSNGGYSVNIVVVDDLTYELISIEDASGTATLNPSADAYVRDGSYANDNYGSGPSLIAKTASGSGFNRRSFLKFDTSTMFGPVGTARLRVFGGYNNTRNTTGVRLEVRAVSDAAWQESSITWNQRPQDGAILASTVIATGTTQRWYEFDISSYVADERAAGRNTVSFAIGTSAATDPFFEFASREAPQNQPELVLSSSDEVWSGQDIGAVAIPGSSTFDETTGVFSIEASGVDIWNSADSFRYVHRTLTGDGEIIARVDSLQNTDPWAKAGLMIRNSLDANAVHASIFVTPSNGVSFQRRLAAGGSSYSTTQGGVVAACWLRLVRSGNTIFGYRSADGSAWTLVGSVSITMGQTVHVGLAVTSHNNSVLTMAAFSNVAFGTDAVAIGGRHWRLEGIENRNAADGPDGGDGHRKAIEYVMNTRPTSASGLPWTLAHGAVRFPLATHAASHSCRSSAIHAAAG